jgi:hypothetical protein
MRGIGVSSGIANGYVVKKNELFRAVEKRIVTDPGGEIARLNNARQKSVEQIDTLLRRLMQENRPQEAQILEAHKALVCDEFFFDEVEQKIRTENVNAEWALQAITAVYLKSFESLEDEYLRERKTDIIDVTGRITDNLLGSGKGDGLDLSANRSREGDWFCHGKGQQDFSCIHYGKILRSAGRSRSGRDMDYGGKWGCNIIGWRRRNCHRQPDKIRNGRF